MAEYVLDTKWVHFAIDGRPLKNSKQLKRHSANLEKFEITLDYGSIDNDGQQWYVYIDN